MIARNAFAVVILVFSALPAAPQEIDLVAIFAKANHDKRVGVTTKTKPVDALYTNPSEIIVSLIRSEGAEAQSELAAKGNWAERNRYAEIDNDFYLDTQDFLSTRCSASQSATNFSDGREFRKLASEMRFLILEGSKEPICCMAPWDEAMVEKPSDVIVQNPQKPKATYRINCGSLAGSDEIAEAL